MPHIVRAWALIVGLACAAGSSEAARAGESDGTARRGPAAGHGALPPNVEAQSGPQGRHPPQASPALYVSPVTMDAEQPAERTAYDEAAPDGTDASAAPLTLSRPEAPLPLAGPGEGRATGRSTSRWQPLATMIGSLAVVLALFFVAAWLMRRGAPAGTLVLPTEVVEVLGRAPLPGRQPLHLVRCGNKLLLLAVSPQGVETLTEITDPAEVERLSGLCQQSHSASASQTFRQLLQQFGREGTDGTFAGGKGVQHG